jgi:hypothetical protein
MREKLIYLLKLDTARFGGAREGSPRHFRIFSMTLCDGRSHGGSKRSGLLRQHASNNRYAGSDPDVRACR